MQNCIQFHLATDIYVSIPTSIFYGEGGATRRLLSIVIRCSKHGILVGNHAHEIDIRPVPSNQYDTEKNRHIIDGEIDEFVGDCFYPRILILVGSGTESNG
jgi:hypothetical protein